MRTFINLAQSDGTGIIVDPNCIIAFDARGNTTSLLLSSGHTVEINMTASSVMNRINSLSNTRIPTSSILPVESR